VARSGDTAAGHELIVAGDNRDAELGLQRGRSGVIGYAAEALVRAARWREAQAQLDQAFALADRMGERIFLPDLLLLRSRIELGTARSAAANASMVAAWREAASQGAKLLELSALVALAEAKTLQADQRDALATARAAITGDPGMPLLVRAAAALN